MQKGSNFDSQGKHSGDKSLRKIRSGEKFNRKQQEEEDTSAETNNIKTCRFQIKAANPTKSNFSGSIKITK